MPAGGQATRASCGHMVSGERKRFFGEITGTCMSPSLPRQKNEMVGLPLAVSRAQVSSERPVSSAGQTPAFQSSRRISVLNELSPSKRSLSEGYRFSHAAPGFQISPDPVLCLPTPQVSASPLPPPHIRSHGSFEKRLPRPHPSVVQPLPHLGLDVLGASLLSRKFATSKASSKRS